MIVFEDNGRSISNSVMNSVPSDDFATRLSNGIVQDAMNIGITGGPSQRISSSLLDNASNCN